MKIKIYGKPNCPYCDRAKTLSAKLVESGKVTEYIYIDAVAEGLDKETLSTILGRPISTFPQIQFEQGNGWEYIGGFTEYYIKFAG